MIKLQKLDNTLFFYSTKHQANISYYVLSFRGKKNNSSLKILRKLFRQAQDLENRLALKDHYAKIAFNAKIAVYSNRYDQDRIFERSINDIIHNIKEIDQACTLGQAIDLVLNGLGTSDQTNKPIKFIKCKEKRIKTYKKIIEAISL